MSKTNIKKGITVKLPVINLETPYKLNQPVVIIPEDEYNELLEDIQDLRDALKAEEEYIVEGGKLFSDYDKKRKKISK
ncbi:MAG: hypothetical protein ABIJ26_04400 [Candidatus Margulisiibacteriota bacterium]|nr:hypothetical protein [Candidatus Margulisiibacteriota bacterium]